MKILFIDAVPNVLRGLGRSVKLEDENWQAAVAFDASQAFALMQQYAFDAVVTDWPETDPDGNDILDGLTAMHPNCSCVVLASNLDHTQKIALQKRRISVLSKPTQWDRIRETIQKAVTARDSRPNPNQTQMKNTARQSPKRHPQTTPNSRHPKPGSKGNLVETGIHDAKKSATCRRQPKPAQRNGSHV